LPEVTMRLADWLLICPEDIRGKVQEFTAEMAGGMAYWVKKDWRVETKEDLDNYTYYVAGLVGVMLSEIWYWYDGTKTDHDLAVAFVAGLQGVNILRNQDEDYEDRGVRFIPDAWKRADVFAYARKKLSDADAQLNQHKPTQNSLLCLSPLPLALRT